VAGLLSGVLFGLFAGQPLNLLGSTGPVYVFEKILFEMCTHQEWDYLSLRWDTERCALTRSGTTSPSGGIQRDVHSPGVGLPLPQVGYREMFTHQDWDYLSLRWDTERCPLTRSGTTSPSGGIQRDVHSPGVGLPLPQVGYREMSTHQEWDYLSLRWWDTEICAHYLSLIYLIKKYDISATFSQVCKDTNSEPIILKALP
jgi:hypothetical protein